MMKAKLMPIRLLGAVWLHAHTTQAVPTVTNIAAGGARSLFIKSDGGLWGMGDNGAGQLGEGTDTRRFSPVRIVGGTPMPMIANISLSGANVIIHGSNGVAGGTYFTRMNASLANPLSQWSPIATDVLVADGMTAITASNAFNPTVPQRFIILQLQ